MSRNDANRVDTWVSISAYSRIYGLSRTTVYALIARVPLRTYQVPGSSVVRVLNRPPSQHGANSQTEAPT